MSFFTLLSRQSSVRKLYLIMNMKKIILLGIVSWFMTADSYAFMPFSGWFGNGCKARWEKCVGWVQSNCAKDTGGCNGSCVFGIRGDCEVDDFQSIGNGAANNQIRDYRPAPITQRKISQPRKKYEDLVQDRSAIKSDGSYELMEKGKLKTIKLNPMESRAIGISIDSAGPKYQNNNTSRSY